MIAILMAGLLSAAGPAFTTAVDKDPKTGWNVIVLRHEDPRDPRLDLEARIAPEMGANLFSFKVGKDELLDHPDDLGKLEAQKGGMPVLFPTPNRVRDAVMTFEGRTFRFRANNEKNFIHGLVRTRPWTARPAHADARAATAVLVLDWDDRQPEWDRFPIKHRLSVTYTVQADGLRIGYRVDNLDRRPLPYGFGLHPYFRIPGARKDVTITVPADQRMEAVALLPTGKLIPVAGTPYDLRRPTPLEGLALDDVYFGLTPAKPAAFRDADRGLEVTFSASREFTHMVVFTPSNRAIFALENQTCSTDAHNLWSQGKKTESHLLIVPPGQSGQGEVIWLVKRARAGK